jgi:hypothetical protein
VLPDKFWAGQECPRTATYGQYHDRTGAYAGETHDRDIRKRDPFPRALKDHHYRVIQGSEEEE